MAKWSFLFFLVVLAVHQVAAARVLPSDKGLNDQKNYLSFGGSGIYGGLGPNGIPFGGVAGVGGGNTGNSPLSGIGGVIGTGPNGNSITGINGFGGLGGLGTGFGGGGAGALPNP